MTQAMELSNFNEAINDFTYESVVRFSQMQRGRLKTLHTLEAYLIKPTRILEIKAVITSHTTQMSTMYLEKLHLRTKQNNSVDNSIAYGEFFTVSRQYKRVNNYQPV
jgi:hypothetical protein